MQPLDIIMTARETESLSFGISGALGVVSFFKGVGVDTFLHAHDLRTTGIDAATPAAPFDAAAAIRHICGGADSSPCISLTRSYAIALDYARKGGLALPTARDPAYVYEIDVPKPLPSDIQFFDPIGYLAPALNDPLGLNTYHHNGGPELLLAIVDPQRYAAIRLAPVAFPPGFKPPNGPPNVSDALVALVNGLRDAEALVVSKVPKEWVRRQHTIDK